VKVLKIAKYQIMDMTPAIIMFYAIFIAVIGGLVALNRASGGNAHSSGLEMATAIFLLISGLNAFKTSFRFSQANQVSRKSFFQGIILAIFPITLAMSVIDLLINRVYNRYVPSPTNFDMIYGTYRDTSLGDLSEIGEAVWTQANDFATLFGTVVWQFAVYSLFFMLGLLISLIYYRCNKIMKVVVSFSPFIFICLLSSIRTVLPSRTWDAIGDFIAGAFGWQSRNPYIAIFTFTVLGVAAAAFIYLLLRKAVVKEP